MIFDNVADAAGHYRWYYVDISGDGFAVVAIFMLGAVFSPTALRAAKRGESPRQNCAVNFAFYRNGKRRAWAFSNHRRAEVEATRLAIGDSELRYENGGLSVDIRERTAPFGAPIRARLFLSSLSPSAASVPLDEHHFWRALAPRAAGVVEIFGERHAGIGYHDSNWGSELLGPKLRGWQWSRVHEADRSEVRIDTSERCVLLDATTAGTTLRIAHGADVPRRRSWWGLPLPTRVAGRAVDATLESSPFYARLGAGDAIVEVADFRRFASPYFRWMAYFRSRAGAAT